MPRGVADKDGCQLVVLGLDLPFSFFPQNGLLDQGDDLGELGTEITGWGKGDLGCNRDLLQRKLAAGFPGQEDDRRSIARRSGGSG